MEEDALQEPVFRANKRRKIFRKRADSEEGDVERATTVHEDNKNASTASDEEQTSAYRVQRKTVTRKNGIAFSSKNRRKDEQEEENRDTALVLASENEEQEMIPGNRFVKPTGKVAVAEDKHMTAFIDSKLAEARSLTPSASITNNVHSEVNGTQTMDRNRGIQPEGVGTSTDQVLRRAESRTYDSAQARNTRVYQRPTKRRPPPQRDQADIARDSMIDQLMNEAQVPLYEQPASRASAVDDAEEDRDAAAAEAFKAQLLAEMEMQNRRRGPKTASKDSKTATAPKGPKLGGSRAQRERMKALEEAKVGSSKK